MSPQQPIVLEDLSGASRVVSGFGHSCAPVAGQVYCWGGNEHHQLGTDAAWECEAGKCKMAVVRVPLPEQESFTGISAEVYLTAALRASGRVWIWAARDEIGGTAVHELQGLQDIIQVGAGCEYVCALRARSASGWSIGSCRAWAWQKRSTLRLSKRSWCG